MIRSTTGSWPASMLNWIGIGPSSELPAAVHSSNAAWAAARVVGAVVAHVGLVTRDARRHDTGGRDAQAVEHGLVDGVAVDRLRDGLTEEHVLVAADDLVAVVEPVVVRTGDLTSVVVPQFSDASGARLGGMLATAASPASIALNPVSGSSPARNTIRSSRSGHVSPLKSPCQFSLRTRMISSSVRGASSE